jgi:transcriptional regulator with XRE-family HTH domain
MCYTFAPVLGEQPTVLRSSNVSHVAQTESFGALVRRYRELRGFNQIQTAALADTDQGAISAIERDEREPSFEMVARLSEALRIPQGEVVNSLAHIIAAARDRVPGSMKDIRAALEMRETMRKRHLKRQGER